MNEVQKYFSKTSNYLSHSFGILLRAEIVRELMGHPSNVRILDVGCGNGLISSQFIDSNHVTFLDLSENMINLARRNMDERYQGNTEFVTGSFLDVELIGKYDYILAIGLLAHVPSVVDCLEKISEILNSGGYAVIQFSDYSNWLTKWNIRNSSHYGYTLNHLEYMALKQLILNSSLRIEREIQFSVLLPGMGRLPDWFLYRYSKAVLRSPLLSRLGSDFIWYVKKI